MPGLAGKLAAFLDAAPTTALVTVDGAKGSTPREAGAWMLVSPNGIFGTIGGGQLEFLAMAKARELILQGPAAEILDIPLGPEIGQCCGGRVALEIRITDDRQRDKLLTQAEQEDARRPHVYLFGAGHVGRALSAALALLPVRVIVVESRADLLASMPEDVESRLSAVPEEVVRAAPRQSAFVVFTHEHQLDFLIVAEALARDDAAYVGMIGSKTKKAAFRSWYLNSGGDESRLPRLVTPIGGADVKDKRPSVIAALAAAEVIRALA